MQYGIIDIGSNTIRLVEYRVEGDTIDFVLNEKYFAQLIHHIRRGELSEEGKKNLLDALANLKKLHEQQPTCPLYCFATAPFRALDDAQPIIDEIHEKLELDVVTLSRDEEARLGVAGAQHLLHVQDGLFVDLGGGSMEVSLVRQGQIQCSGVIDCGSVSLSDRFVGKVFPNKRELAEIRDYIDKRLEELRFAADAAGLDLYCMGGTARSLSQIHRALRAPDTAQDEYSFPCGDIKDVYKIILRDGVEGIRLLTKVCPGRLFTFVPGVVVLHRLAKLAQTRNVHFSSFGVREGYLIERLLSQETSAVL